MTAMPASPPAPPAAATGKAQRPSCRIVSREDEIELPRAAFTLNGFRKWVRSKGLPHHGRLSFLDGEVRIDMSPEEVEKHAKIKAEVSSVIHQLAKKLNLGEFLPDGVQLSNTAAGLSTEPDGFLVTWDSYRTGRVERVARRNEEGEFIECVGTPDWVLEVVSESSVRKDTQVLRRLYFRAGIPEYWLIDGRGAEIDFQLLVRGKNDYEPVPAKKGWVASPLVARLFRLTRRVVIEGHLEYTLQMKKARKHTRRGAK